MVVYSVSYEKDDGEDTEDKEKVVEEKGWNRQPGGPWL